MKITVIIATYNGAPTLPRVLDAYRNQLIPNDVEWNMVVVNNASTDDTAAVLDDYTRLLPLQVMYATARGTNCARNVALESANADLLVFSDDDAIPDSDWLQCLVRAARRHPEYDLFGGTIEPDWPSMPPEWLDCAGIAEAAFALTTEQHRHGPIKAELIFGPNMAVRGHIFRQGMRFDESIGPRGQHYPMGAETELLVRLDSLGHRAWFCSPAKVRHIIRPWQFTQSWLLQRAINFGRGQERIKGMDYDPQVRSIAHVPLRLIRRIASHHLKSIGEAVRGSRNARLRQLWWRNYYTGVAIERRTRWKQQHLQAAQPGTNDS